MFYWFIIFLATTIVIMQTNVNEDLMTLFVGGGNFALKNDIFYAYFNVPSLSL